MKKQKVSQTLADCSQVLSAIGDSTRQLVIRAFIESEGCRAMRVGDIQQKISISRTALSHHLKVLMDAGVISMYKDGTKNFYYIDPRTSKLRLLSDFWQQTTKIAYNCPHKSKKEK